MNAFTGIFAGTKWWLVCLLTAIGGQVADVALGANTSTYAIVEKGNAAYRAGRYDEALKHYKEASVAIPESAELYFNQGTVHYRQGDYEAATDAFSQAALRSKDPLLEANARYNQGNCAFREAERQRDSDLNKAIEACGTAIGHYQDVRHGGSSRIDGRSSRSKVIGETARRYQKAPQLDALVNKAAENIEVVRLYLKALLDEQQKKEEEQQQQDDLGKKLKELLERQVAAVKENGEVAAAKPESPTPSATAIINSPREPEPSTDPLASGDPDLGDSALTEPGESQGFGAPEPEPEGHTAPGIAAIVGPWRKSVDEHAATQGALLSDTSAVLEEMRQMEMQMSQQAAQGTGPAQPGGTPPPSAQPNKMVEKLGTAIGHVDESVKAQGAAGDVLSKTVASSDESLLQQGVAGLNAARAHQQQSAQQLAEALKALSDPQQNQQQQDQDQDQSEDQQGDQQEKDQQGKEGEDQKDGEDQKGEDQDQQQEGEQSQGEPGEEEKEEKKQSALKPLDDSAEDILNEEKENQKRRMPVRSGGVRPVDKDW